MKTPQYSFHNFKKQLKNRERLIKAVLKNKQQQQKRFTNCLQSTKVSKT